MIYLLLSILSILQVGVGYFQKLAFFSFSIYKKYFLCFPTQSYRKRTIPIGRKYVFPPQGPVLSEFYHDICDEKSL